MLLQTFQAARACAASTALFTLTMFAVAAHCGSLLLISPFPSVSHPIPVSLAAVVLILFLVWM